MLRHLERDDHPDGAGRDQPKPEQQCHRPDADSRMADEHDADDYAHDAEHRCQPAASDIRPKRAHDRNDPIDEHEYACDHSEGRKAVAGLSHDDDSRGDTHHPNERDEPPRFGHRVQIL